jgi:hypothetical protein
LLGADRALEVGHAYDFTTTTNKVTLGGIATGGASFGEDHRVASTLLLGRITDNEARIYQGKNRDLGGDIRVSRLRFIERTLAAAQAQGHHAFPFLFGVETDWSYTYALALRSEPDTREARYDRQASGRWILSDRPEGNGRLFSSLTDHSHDASLVVRYPFTQWNGLPAHVETGAQVAAKTRLVDTRRFKFQHKGTTAGDTDVLSSPPELAFRKEHIDSDGFQITEVTRETDNYDAQQLVAGAHLGGELPLWHGVRAAAGIRLEYGHQTVRTYQLFNPDDEPVLADLQTLDALPSASLTWEILEGLQVRTSGSITLSRPDFRELSPATFNDVTGGRQQYGNPDLERAQIWAADARLEWYPTTAVELSVGGFYKHFFAPIEQVVVVSAQHSVTYANAIAADNVGVEAEAKHDFGWMHDVVRGAFVAGNVALIYSQVTLDEESGIQTSTVRPLQGQSPFVVNLQGGYDNPDRGPRVVVVYNVFGPRIAEVGAGGAPDVYEQPVHQLDVVASQSLPMGFSLGLKAENLIDLPAQRTQGGIVIDSVRTGRAISASLGWSW